RKIKSCAAAYVAFGPDSASVAMNDTLHRRQSDSGAFKLVRSVQTLEYSKQFVGILHVETNSIILNEYNHTVCWFVRASYLNLRCRARAGEFDGIGNQIDKCKLQHRPVSIQIGQGPNLPSHVAPFRLTPNFVLNFFYQLLHADHGLTRFCAPDSGKGQQV